MRHLFAMAVACVTLFGFFGNAEPLSPQKQTDGEPAKESSLNGFAKIPKNPGFSFAKGLSARQPGMKPPKNATGEKSPISEDYFLAIYPVTNGDYNAFCKETGHKIPNYWQGGTFPKGADIRRLWTTIHRAKMHTASLICAEIAGNGHRPSLKLPTAQNADRKSMPSAAVPGMPI